MPSVGGDIELMPLTDICLWLGGKKLTGTLNARRRGVEVRFTLREGLCAQSSSTDPREYLGQHLINFGHIDEEQLQQAFDTQKETRVPLGRVLVMVELVTTAQLQTVIHFKTREGLLEALGWRDGTWRFVPETDADPELDADLKIDMREAVSEAMAREAMWSEIRRVFPSDGTRCDVLIDPVRVDSAFDRKLLERMATGASVGETALELRAMDFQVYARLYDLANRQLVRPVLTSTIKVGPATGSLAPPASTPPAPASTPPTPAPPAATTAAPALFPTPVAPASPMPLTAPRSPTPAVIVAPPAPAPVVAPTPPTPALFPLPQPPTPATGGPAFSSGFALGRIALGTKAIPAAPSTTKTAPVTLPVTKTPAPLVPVAGWGASAATTVPSPPAKEVTTVPSPPATSTKAPPTPSIAASVHELTLEVEIDVEGEPDVEEDLPRWTAPRAPQPLSASTADDAGTYMMVKRSPPQESPIRALEVALAGRNWAEAVLLAQRILEHDPHDSEAIAALRVADAQLRRLEKQGAGGDIDFNRVPHLTRPLADVPQAHLTSKERYVLSRIDGARSLAQIAAVSPVQRAELARIVESFVQQGVLRYG